jgi:hypothetical protein
MEATTVRAIREKLIGGTYKEIAARTKVKKKFRRLKFYYYIIKFDSSS